MKKIFLINHIPKCAGSSLRKSLENNFKDELLNLSYNPIRSGKYEYTKLIYTKFFVKNFRSKIFIGKSIIHGHFCYDDIPDFPNHKKIKICFFRDPIEWFGSFYFWEKNYRKRNTGDPITFLKNYKLNSAFKRHLGEVNIEDLDFVGLVEKYSESISLLNDYFNLKIENVLINRNKDNYYDYKTKLSKLCDINYLKKSLEENFQYYYKAQEKFDTLKILKK